MELNIKPRCLLGPGPSSVHPRVLQALSYPFGLKTPSGQ